MKIKISPSSVSGYIKIHGSKSELIRALTAAMLAEGVSTIHNVSKAEDVKSTVSFLRQCGAECRCEEDSYKVKGNPVFPQKIFCGESAFLFRIAVPLAAAFGGSVKISGKNSIFRRPVDMMKSPLEKAGVCFSSASGFPPVEIAGKMKPGVFHVDGGRTSQFLSGLLMSLPLLSEDSQIFAENIVSKPYVEMTIRILSEFGIDIECKGDGEFFIPGKQRYCSSEFHVEGDYSGAAFFLVAGAICGKISVSGLNPYSEQGDRAVLDYLKAAEVRTVCQKTSITVKKSSPVAFEADLTHTPDLFPPLVTLAVFAEGSSFLHGVHRLNEKESDRAEELVKGFNFLGGYLEIKDNTMIVHGGRGLSGGHVKSAGDHRLAMAYSVAALGAEKSITVEGCEHVKKSFPDFFDILDKIGGDIK